MLWFDRAYTGNRKGNQIAENVLLRVCWFLTAHYESMTEPGTDARRHNKFAWTSTAGVLC
jgi:hypothetical protein